MRLFFHADGHFNIPEGAITIEAGSWKEWGVDGKKVKTVTIPATVTTIGCYAFTHCSALAAVAIPDSVTSIRWGAFRGCSALTTITIPGSVTSIGSMAFYGCSSLVILAIPDGVTSIGWDALCECSSLATISIPSSVTSIEYNAFQGCSSLTAVTIPDSVTKIRAGAFYGCSSLTTITLPPCSVASIEQQTFCGCSSLATITIRADSVASIGFRAFWGCCSLATITIPENVASIECEAFDGCSSLATLLVQPAIAPAAAGSAPQRNATELNKIPLANLTQIWASDHIINQLAGPFNDYSALAEVPRAMQAVPDAPTYAAGALYFWWSDPELDAGKGRVLSRSRQQMVWTVMHVALRLETTSTSPELADVLPPEMWMLIMTFVKHV